MAAKVTNDGERFILDTALVHGGALTIKLAQADFAEGDSMVSGDFVEANYDGYASQTLSYLGLEAGSPGGRAIADFADTTFACTGNATPNLIYGYWVESGAGNVILCERFTGSPRPMQENLQTVIISIAIRLWSPT